MQVAQSGQPVEVCLLMHYIWNYMHYKGAVFDFSAISVYIVCCTN